MTKTALAVLVEDHCSERITLASTERVVVAAGGFKLYTLSHNQEPVFALLGEHFGSSFVDRSIFTNDMHLFTVD